MRLLHPNTVLENVTLVWGLVLVASIRATRTWKICFDLSLPSALLSSLSSSPLLSPPLPSSPLLSSPLLPLPSYLLVPLLSSPLLSSPLLPSPLTIVEPMQNDGSKVIPALSTSSHKFDLQASPEKLVKAPVYQETARNHPLYKAFKLMQLQQSTFVTSRRGLSLSSRTYPWHSYGTTDKKLCPL